MTAAQARSLEETISITPEEFAKLCEFFYRRTGIVFSEKKRYFVERRVQERIAKTRSSGFRDYFGLLRFQASGEELQQLVNLMTVNETYFFREDYQFTALTRGMLPELASTRRPGERIRIWSLPCSTGEEPYSIAIHVLENWPQCDQYEIQILASDIDSRVLADAVRGVYGERSLQRVGPSLRQKYFEKTKADEYRLRDEIRESIDFSTVNVVDRMQMAGFHGLDVIFCRNLLIYFDDLGRRETVETLYECLAPGGFICLGHSENMSRMTSLFRPRKFADTIVHQKPMDAE
ncbi:CheR family methyltransferase [Rhodoplanes sp. SY1]|uniref:CheR family methyltransferase n=1 Tax=Rhodoplanes sp. SY1 TaxID=3166646 RepID=UPI0038B536E4